MQSPILKYARLVKEEFLRQPRSNENQPLGRWQGQCQELALRLCGMFGNIYRDREVNKVEELSDESIYTIFWTEVDAYYQSLGPQGVQQLHSLRAYLDLPSP